MSLFRRAVSAVRIAPSSGSRQVVSKRTSVQCLNYSCTQVRTFRFSSYVSAEGDPDEVKRCTTEVGKPSARILRIADDVLALDLLEINQLLRNVQKRLNLPDDYFTNGGGMGGGGPRVAAAGGGAAAAAAPVKEKEAFDLKLTEVDAKSKIKIIKEVRAITGLGLKEAKEMVENAPVVVKQGLKKEEAEKLQKVLVEAGAKAELL